MAVEFDVKISHIQNAVKVFDEMPHTNPQNLTVQKPKHKHDFRQNQNDTPLSESHHLATPYLFIR